MSSFPAPPHKRVTHTRTRSTVFPAVLESSMVVWGVVGVVLLGWGGQHFELMDQSENHIVEQFGYEVCCSVLQCAVVCYSVAACCVVSLWGAVCCSEIQCDSVCWGVLQCVAVCCSVLSV